MSNDADATRTDARGPIVDRRTLLGGIALSASAGSTGCISIANLIADEALGDVNVFNETARRMRGEIEVTGPDGSTVLSETFDLEAQSEDDPNGAAMVAYEEVWETAGDYRVDVILEEGYEVREQSSVESVVTIDDPDEQMLGIGLGIPDREDGIVTLVAREWSGFAES